MACGAAIGLEGALQSTGRAVTGLLHASRVKPGTIALWGPAAAGMRRRAATAATDGSVRCRPLPGSHLLLPDPAVFLAEAAGCWRLAVCCSWPAATLIGPILSPETNQPLPHRPGVGHLAAGSRLAGSETLRRLCVEPGRQPPGGGAATASPGAAVTDAAGDQPCGIPAQARPAGASSSSPPNCRQMYCGAVETLSLNLLPPDKPDQVHRVIYALGHAPGD